MLSKRSPEGRKLTDCVQKELDKLHRLKKPGILIINAGKGGEMATAGHGRITDAVLAHTPAVVTVSYGLNDTNVLTPQQFKQAMLKIVAALKKACKARIVYTELTGRKPPQYR